MAAQFALADVLLRDFLHEPLAPGLTPEMVAAVSKLLRNQALVAAARRPHAEQKVPAHGRRADAGFARPLAV